MMIQKEIKSSNKMLLLDLELELDLYLTPPVYIDVFLLLYKNIRYISSPIFVSKGRLAEA
jgi:hypothetical protein